MPPPKVNKKSKTSRFPVARIKKIMQMDEEVGKLASATPVMISKSLECFLQMLLDETSKETRARGSKKMLAHHLKTTINNHPSFDFLRELVEAVPDPVEALPKASTSHASNVSHHGGPSGGSKRKPSGVDSASFTINAGSSGSRKRGAGGVGAEHVQSAGHGYDGYGGYGTGAEVKKEGENVAVPGSLPTLETWKRDPVGGGGAGENGKGMFDDYEDEFDDY